MWENETPLQIDPDYLTGMVRAALGNPKLEIVGWACQPIYAGFEYSSRLFRLQGQAFHARISQSWSLILKIIQPDTQNNDPHGFRYWKRDALAYQSGLLDNLPGPISVPHCYDICAQPDGSLWLWLEEIRDDFGSSWSLEQYAQAARCLGEFNGAYVMGRPLPDASWITHGWLRKYLENAGPVVDFIRQHPDHPVVQDLFPGSALAQVLAVWDLYPPMLQILDGMPQAFCHQDAFLRNLFLNAGKLIAIDWGYAGIAPLGAELAALIGAGFQLAKFPPSNAQELDKACFNGYLEGLNRAGWRPDPRQVRLGYILTIVLRYVVANMGEGIPTLLNQDLRARYSAGVEIPAEQVGKSDPHTIAYYQGICLEILRRLGLGFSFQFLVRTGYYSIRLRRNRQPASGKT